VPKIDITPSPDKTTVRIVVPSEPQVTLSLDAAHLDMFIKALADARGALLPEHPMDLAPGTKVNAVTDPRWSTAQEPLTGGSVLHLRDPRYGWMHFVLPRHEAARLGKLMQLQAEAPLPEMTAN